MFDVRFPRIPMNTNNLVILQKNNTNWLMFTDPVDILQAVRCDEVRKTLEAVEKAVETGLFAAGFLSYEAAPGLDHAFSTHQQSSVPLVWFGLYRNVEELESLPAPNETASATAMRHRVVSEWEPSISQTQYRDAIARIRKYIAEGDTYQVNYTIRLKTAFQGDPYSFFCSLCRAQQAQNCVFINMDSHTVCSASPELFFAVDGTSVISRPMKGTAPRGLTCEADAANAKSLQESEKNRAENIMIVDMIRNDLGRVAKPGTVRVSSVFDIERYPTVLQMTSTVQASTSASFSEIMAALFPCASITGAPKVHTMEIIRELEPEPRGIYTGAIGYLTPGKQARFNVAIRTVVIDRKSGMAEYGVGGGIVWESEAEDEYKECLAKASVLTRELPEFDLLETMLWTPEDGYFLLDRHLRRLEQSAEYFNFNISREQLAKQLIEFAASLLSRRSPWAKTDGGEDRGEGTETQSLPHTNHKVRLCLSQSGKVSLESTPIENKKKPIKVMIAEAPVHSGNPFLYHKTTNRRVYDSARVSRPPCDDVILYNERGEVTETTIANIVVAINGERLTPPVECGLLPGTFRQYLLDRGEIREAVIKLADLAKAEKIYLINSVRKWTPSTLSLARRSHEGRRPGPNT